MSKMVESQNRSEYNQIIVKDSQSQIDQIDENSVRRNYV